MKDKQIYGPTFGIYLGISFSALSALFRYFLPVLAFPFSLINVPKILDSAIFRARSACGERVAILIKMAEIKAKFGLVKEVSALQFDVSGQWLVVAVGPYLKVYQVFLSRLVFSELVMENCTIHGVWFSSDGSLLALFDQKRLTILHFGNAIEQKDFGLMLNQRKDLLFRDAVLAVRFLDDPNLIVVGFAHNFVEVWNFENREKQLYSECSARCIVYAMSFHGETQVLHN